jgi:hypothetical protein
MPDPILVKHRREAELPVRMKFVMLALQPILARDLTLTQEPTVTCSMTLIL